jgi:hypothetical protein
MAQKEPEIIALDQMQEAILRSGYLLEQRIKPKIADYGYFVETNQPYPDPQTGISREYDISAISGRMVYRGGKDFIFPYIICECENNTQPLVFFESRSPISFLFHEDVKCSGIPVKIWERGQWLRLSAALDFEKFHHYCHGVIATQYCSFTKKNHWIATHLEPQHHTIRNLINALEATIDDHFASYTLPRKGQEEPVNVQFYYPMVVVQGKLCLAKQSRRGLQIRDVKHVQFRQEQWSTERRTSYQIDIIQESFLGNYLRMIDQEMEMVTRRMKRRRKTIRASIAKLVLLAKLKKKSISFRQVHDFYDS